MTSCNSTSQNHETVSPGRRAGFRQAGKNSMNLFERLGGPIKTGEAKAAGIWFDDRGVE